jgi:hypothetical protein
LPPQHLIGRRWLDGESNVIAFKLAVVLADTRLKTI